MHKIKLFLASSNELKAERERFEINIYRKTKAWFPDKPFLHLDIWEDHSSKVADTRSQDKYNRLIKEETDLFILLVDSKVGMYSAEEFEVAFGAFQAKQKPYIYTYFKKREEPGEPSLLAFQEKLKDLGHFFAIYQNSDDLWNQFNNELDRLEVEQFGAHSWGKVPPPNVHVDNRGATIKNQFNGGTFHNPTFK